MSHLVVIGFKNDKFKAGGFLNELQRLDAQPTVQLNDAVAVYRDDGGKLNVDRSYVSAKDDNPARGLLWGSIVGALLAIPFTAVTGGAVAATIVGMATVGGGATGAMLSTIDSDWWKEGFGISEDFISEVGALLEPGDSAVFAVLYAEHPDDVMKRFEGSGGKVLMTDLSDDQRAMIDKVLGGSLN